MTTKRTSHIELVAWRCFFFMFFFSLFFCYMNGVYMYIGVGIT